MIPKLHICVLDEYKGSLDESNAINVCRMPKRKENWSSSSDRGGEYFYLECDAYCEEHDITHKNKSFSYYIKMDLVEIGHMLIW